MSGIATLDGARATAASGPAREVFNAMHPGNPAITMRCAGTADVIAGVNFAREHGLCSRCAGEGTRSPGCRRSTAAC